MRKMYLLIALAILLPAALANAQSPFDGTWKTNMNNVDFPKKPDVYVLKDGMYSCKTCTPPYTIKADGSDQKITDPYVDTMAVKVVNDHEIELTGKKNGKVVQETKVTVSPDGNTMMFEFTDSSNTNGAPVTGKGEATRVAKGPAGSSPVSGSWRMSKMSNMSDNAITYTYKTNGDELTMTNGTGQSYTAKMDGSDAPMKGDPGVTTVSVKRIGKNGFEETDKRDGKVIGVFKATVSSDGKTLTGVYDDKQHGTSAKFTATKQE
ncbi:MAG TPA: hypothetical protein VFB04_10345 [Terriglobales bacterium]|nr:hypothetical protein [Terriglobales bacterium]